MEAPPSDDDWQGYPRPCTIITFRIIAPLYELHDQIIDLPIRAGIARVHVTIVDSGLPRIWRTVDAQITIPGDERGILHNSIVDVVLPGIAPLGLPAPEGTPPTPGQIPEGLQAAVRLLNTVIGHYRVQNSAPEIRLIPASHARAFKYQFFYENGTGSSGQFFGGNGLPFDGEAANVPAANGDVVESIQRAVEAGPLPLWASLYMDALADFAASNALSGLAHLYISFEMLAHAACQRLGQKAIGADAVERYLSPSANEEPPKVYSVVLRCRDFAGGLSRQQVRRLTSKLWKHRNDVLHGRPIRITPEIVNSAAEAYRTLAEWLTSAVRNLD